METKLLEQTSKYKGRVFEVLQQRLDVDGNVIVRDVVMKSPCVVCLVRHIGRDTVVLTKEFRIGTFEEEVGFIAGMIDEGEQPIQAAIRETIEETGYTPVSVEYLGDSLSSTGFTNEHIHHFYVQVEGEPEIQRLDKDEHITITEVSFNKLLELIGTGWIRGNHAHANVLKAILNGVMEVRDEC